MVTAGELAAQLAACDPDMPVAIVHVDRRGHSEQFRIDALEVSGYEVAREPVTLNGRAGWLVASPPSDVEGRQSLLMLMPSRLALGRRCGCTAVVPTRVGAYSLDDVRCRSCQRQVRQQEGQT